MQIVQEQPPFVDQLGKVFRLPEGAIFTFGDVIYNPSGNPIDQPLLMHEGTHSLRQGNDPSGWWQKYIKDDKFRLGEELLAYRVQYGEAKKYIKDRNALAKYLFRLAGDLSSAMYGNVVTRSEALKLIKMT